MPRRRLAGRVAATAAALALAGTAIVLMGQGATGSSLLAADGTGPTTTAPSTATITISGIAGGFTPNPQTVAKGGTVTVTNEDPNFSHTFTSNAVDAKGRPLFDVTLGKAGSATASATVDVSLLGGGSYTYYCRFHPTMTGTLIIDGPPDADPPPDDPPYAQPLVQPKRLTGRHPTIVMKQAYVQVFPDGPATRMLTYGGSFPGPTIVRPTGSDTKVTYVNKLPRSVGSVTIHQHGGHQKSSNDGQPASYVIAHGRSKTYDYPLRDGGKPLPAALRFYHDHRMDRTARNNWYGLSGMFLTTDSRDARMGLPHGQYDVPLMVTDRTFDENNQLIDPWSGQASSTSAADSDPMSSAMAGMTDRAGAPSPETTGQQVLVNGRYHPYLTVHRGLYRFQILNASLFSSYTFALSNGQPFTQIGNGGGLIPHPVVRQSIMLGPAQRADVVVDFSQAAPGDKVVLSSVPRNDGSTTGIGTRTATLMQFQVDDGTAPSAKVPATLMKLPRMTVPKRAAMAWNFGLSKDKHGTFWSINGKRYNPKRVDHKVRLGRVQRWVLRNRSDITHYVHLHEELWRTISRDGKRPPPWERGYEDTWQLDPGETVVVAARFTDFTGKFMVHCHMLDHEDDGMMATFEVTRR